MSDVNTVSGKFIQVNGPVRQIPNPRLLPEYVKRNSHNLYDVKCPGFRVLMEVRLILLVFCGELVGAISVLSYDDEIRLFYLESPVTNMTRYPKGQCTTYEGGGSRKLFLQYLHVYKNFLQPTRHINYECSLTPT